jgi:hypothetical protein
MTIGQIMLYIFTILASWFGGMIMGMGISDMDIPPVLWSSLLLVVVGCVTVYLCMTVYIPRVEK